MFLLLFDTDDSPEEEQRLQQLAQGLLCCDPQVQLG